MAKICMFLTALCILAQSTAAICNNWCPGFQGMCCDHVYRFNVEKPAKVIAEKLYHCPITLCSEEESANLGNEHVEECNKFDPDTKCPEHEFCCPDDCLQKFVCKVGGGKIKQCPARKCVRVTKEMPRKCEVNKKSCSQGELCCPDDCTSDYICKRADYIVL